MSSDFEEQFAKSTGELTEDLAADFLAPRLLVIENAVGSGQHDDSKLRMWNRVFYSSQIA
jgi:hypothetical protein